jgi:hypothetical protein
MAKTPAVGYFVEISGVKSEKTKKQNDPKQRPERVLTAVANQQTNAQTYLQHTQHNRQTKAVRSKKMPKTTQSR